MGYNTIRAVLTIDLQGRQSRLRSGLIERFLRTPVIIILILTATRQISPTTPPLFSLRQKTFEYRIPRHRKSWRFQYDRTVSRTRSQLVRRTDGHGARVQTDGRADRQADRLADRRTDRRTDRQTDRQTDEQTDGQTD